MSTFPGNQRHLTEVVRAKDDPTNTARSPSAVLLLVQRLRRWPNINTALGERVVFAWEVVAMREGQESGPAAQIKRQHRKSVSVATEHLSGPINAGPASGAAGHRESARSLLKCGQSS